VFRRVRCRASRNALAGLIVGIAVALPPGSAPAQNLFDFIFGAFRGGPPDAPIGAYDPHRIAPRPLDINPSEPGLGRPHMAYCVRLCDGRFFPIQAYRNASASAQCKSFCPASATKIFSGESIEHAVAGDGRRYADLPNAFVHRQRIVPGCACHARSTTGVAHLSVADDPTLRLGDIVATNSGLTVYRGKNSQRQAVFTPIGAAKISKSLRNQLADVKVTPRLSTADAPFTVGSQHEASAIPRDRGGLSGPRRPFPRAAVNVLIRPFQFRTD